MSIKEIKWFNDKKNTECSIFNKYGDIYIEGIKQFLEKINISFDTINYNLDNDIKQKNIQILKENILKICVIYIHCINHIDDIEKNIDKYHEIIDSLYNDGKTDNDFEIINYKYRINILPNNYNNIINIIKNSKETDNALLKNIINSIDDNLSNKKQSKETNNKVSKEENDLKMLKEQKRKQNLKNILSNYTMDGNRLENIEKYGVSFKPMK